jgi:hypothetical protein
MATPPDFTVGQVLTAAQMNAVGMWKTGSVTLTGQTTAQINNCFSADFDNYLLIYSIKGTSSGFYFRLSVGGVPNATANSYIQSGRYVGYPGVGAGDFNASGDSFGLSFYSTFMNAGNITIVAPFKAEATSFSGTYNSQNASVYTGGYHNQNTSYDGLYFYNTTASAMTGTITVIGINQ